MMNFRDLTPDDKGGWITYQKVFENCEKDIICTATLLQQPQKGEQREISICGVKCIINEYKFNTDKVMFSIESDDLQGLHQMVNYFDTVYRRGTQIATKAKSLFESMNDYHIALDIVHEEFSESLIYRLQMFDPLSIYMDEQKKNTLNIIFSLEFLSFGIDVVDIVELDNNLYYEENDIENPNEGSQYAESKVDKYIGNTVIDDSDYDHYRVLTEDEEDPFAYLDKIDEENNRFDDLNQNLVSNDKFFDYNFDKDDEDEETENPFV